MSNDEKQEGKKTKKLTLLLAVVAVLALMGVVISLYTLFMKEDGVAAPKPAGTVEGPYEVYGPQDFTVNLSDGGQRRYLKVTMALGYKEKALAKELEKRSAQVRDLILEVLRQRSADEVATGEGTEALRADLIQQINAILSSGTIEEIYFTDFLVQ